MFDPAIDSKLRGCDVLVIKVDNARLAIAEKIDV
jgi:hypothetical protein